MIKPAYEYRNEIYDLLHKAKFKGNTEFLTNSQGLLIYSIQENNDEYQSWAIFSSDEQLIGYITYYLVNNEAKVFHMINFTKNYIDYGYGLIEVYRKIFFEQNAESISWMAHKHNPAKHSYKKLCLAFQGKIKSTPTAVYYMITRSKIDKIFTNIKKEK